MTSERIKEIQEQTAYPQSTSVKQALLQVWNECEQDKDKKLYSEELERLFNEMKSKVDPDFNFEFEHWDNGNFDDSYEYGIEVGEEYTYREIVDKLTEILKNNTVSVEPKFTLELTKAEALGLVSCLLKTSASGTDLVIGEMIVEMLLRMVLNINQ